jgi:hypothetical protein
MMKVVVALTPVAAIVCGIFAQGTASVEQVPGWLSVVIQLGSFGLVAFLIVAGLPRLHAELKAERKAERDSFSGMLEKINDDRRTERADFAAAIRAAYDFARVEAEAVRVSAKSEVETLRTVFIQEQRETRAFYADEAKSMRTLYMDAVAAMRTAVHDVRDVANVTVNEARVALKVAEMKG